MSDEPEQTQCHRTVTFAPGEVAARARTANPEDMPTQLGRFQVRQLLGEGAFGRVYLADDPTLKREVALKVIRPDKVGGDQHLRLFQREARAAALLQHPNIVPVFDSGEEGTQHYIASAFVRGRSLDRILEKIPEGQYMPLRDAVIIVRKLAEALAYAHKQGVIHRDVKPANVMLRDDSEPMLMDFGLAARLDEQKMTVDHHAMGTPGYMALEQLLARPVPASDQYSLGCLLHELLTRRTPYVSSGMADYLAQHIHAHHKNEPVPSPRKYRADLPRDLETICLKCLEREPERRYADCQTLADDLRRWLDDEPIAARRPTLGERLVRWARRNPAVAALLGTIMGLTLAALWIISTLYAQAASDATAARQAEGREKQRAVEARQAGDRALDQEKLALQQKEQADAQRDRAERLVYVSNIALAQQAWEAGNARVAFERLEECQWNLRGWEHDQMWTQFNSNQYTFKGHTGTVHSVAWSPDGKRLASASGDNTVKVWDAVTGQVVSSLKGHTDDVNSVAWSPDGKRLASASDDKTVKVWDAATGQEVSSLKGHTNWVTSVAWSPDGKRLASASWDETVKVWDAATGQEVSSLKGHTSSVSSVAWSPDGKRLASASFDKMVKVWDAATGQEVSSLKGHTSSVSSVAWSPDGKRLASASGDNTVKVWDAVTGQVVSSLKGHTDDVNSVAWSPDGKRLASASDDKTVKVWDAATGQEVSSLKGHTNWVTSVAWSPDGKRLASASWDETVKVWDAATGQEVSSLKGHTDRVSSVAWSPDSKRLASARWDSTVKVWDAATGQQVSSLTGHTRSVFSVAWSPDGKRLASASWDETVKVWDAATGQEVSSLKGHTNRVSSVAWSPDGKRLASGSADNTVKVWDAATKQDVSFLQGHIDRVNSVAWSPDGKRLASASADRTVKVWVAATGQLVFSWIGHTDGVENVAWSPDGHLVVARGTTGKLLAWDAMTGKAETPPANLPTGDGLHALSPDRQVLARAAGDDIRLERRSEAQRARDRAFLARLSRFDPDWHLAQANDAEDSGTPFAAAFHLDQLLREQPWNANLHLRQAHALDALGRSGAASLHLVQASLLAPGISPWPSDPGAVQRGDKSAEAGDFSRAARALLTASRQPSARGQIQQDLLLAQLRAGEAAAARRTAEALASAVLASPGLSDENLLLHVLLVPLQPAQTKNLAEVTQQRLEHQRSVPRLQLHGIALYRADRFREAASVLEQASKAKGKEPSSITWLFQAMTAKHLGRTDEARKHLVRFTNDYDPETGTWQDSAIRTILLDETRRILDGPPRMPIADEAAPR